MQRGGLYDTINEYNLITYCRPIKVVLTFPYEFCILPFRTELNNADSYTSRRRLLFCLTEHYGEGKDFMQTFNIAIDGPAGAGKSTIARLVAKRLNFKYVDTGAMYRAVTWLVLKKGLSIEREGEKISCLTQNMNLALDTTEEGTRVFVDGEDITEQIRSVAVTSHVSAVAKIPGVRDALLAKQRQLAAEGGVVMDGRDIGSTVLPDAEVKIFLTANLKERARRRFREMQVKGIDADLDTVEREIKARDQLDSTRAISPLVRATDAEVIDTTHLSAEQVVEKIIAYCRMKTASLK